MGKLKNKLFDYLAYDRFTDTEHTVEPHKTSYKSFSSTKEYLDSLPQRKRLIARFKKVK